MIQCLGCDNEHAINVDPTVVHRNEDGSVTPHPCWTFNGDLDRPTFSPSLLVRSGKYANPEWYAKLTSQERRDFADRISNVCHSYIVNGQIQYLHDCTHKYVNQTIELPDYEFEWELFY